MDVKEIILKMENLIFKIGQQESYKDLHTTSLHILKDLYGLEKQNQETSPSSRKTKKSNMVTDETEKEILKVERKLEKWAKNQNIIPAQILTAYLLLKKGKSFENFINKEILGKAIEKRFGDSAKFSANFSQMKNVSEKNHAKIFDVSNRGNITIWEPIIKYVNTYKENVL